MTDVGIMLMAGDWLDPEIIPDVHREFDFALCNQVIIFSKTLQK